MEHALPNLKEHAVFLDEIRTRIYNLVLIFFVIFVGSFLAAGYIISVPVKLFKIPNVTIATSSPFQYMDLATDIAFACAVCISLPLLIYHLYAFLQPALNHRERRLFFQLLPLTLLLFVLGSAYGVVIMYFAFGALANLNTSLGITNIWDISQSVSQLAVTSLLLGSLFEMPLVLTFLLRAKWLKRQTLSDKRRHIYVGIFAFIALLPPTDGISLLLMALPMIAIYEITLLINKSQNISQIINT